MYKIEFLSQFLLCRVEHPISVWILIINISQFSLSMVHVDKENFDVYILYDITWYLFKKYFSWQYITVTAIYMQNLLRKLFVYWIKSCFSRSSFLQYLILNKSHYFLCRLRHRGVWNTTRGKSQYILDWTWITDIVYTYN